MRRQAQPVAVLLAAMLLAVPLAHAAETRTVEVSAEVYGHGRTPEQAKQEALQRARDQAVTEVSGIQIAAQQMRLKSEAPGGIRDGFSYLVHTSTYGRIVKEDVAYATRLEGETPVYRATLRAEVVMEEGPRDPGFALELRTLPESHTFRVGESVVLEISASRRCYLTVLNLDATGRLGILFPNAYDAENRIAAGESVRLPRSTKPFEIRVSYAGDAALGREQLLVVATLDEVPFALPDSTEDELVPVSDRESALTALNRWLVQIPANRRAEALWSYEVVK
jgi:hypothetical protein